jgi:hypothetical protein
MNAKELRVGNLVTIDKPELKDMPLRVTGINQLERYDKVITYSVYLEHSQISDFIKPIHLTESILFKCGFENTEFGYGDKYIDIECIGRGNYKLSIKCGDHVLGFGQPINNLHKLQNIYFELTGEELDVSSLFK